MRTSVSASVTVALAGAVVLGSGLDSPQGARRRLLNNLGEGNAIELYQDAVTVVTGDYWVAWPYAFALNMLYERAEGTRPVLAVALRSDDVYTRRAGQIRTGTRVAVVPTSDYRYWTFKGPVVALSVLRAETAYEVAVVQSYVEGLAGKVGIADQGSRADRQQPPVRNAADKLAVD